MLQEGASGKPLEEIPDEGFPQEGGIEPPEQPRSPGRLPLEAPLAGASPLQQRGHARLEVTASVTPSGTAACSFAGRNASLSSNTTHLAAIAAESTLSELRRLGLYTRASLPDIAQQTYGQESSVEYAYAATNVSRRSAGKKAEAVPTTFQEAMTLPAKAQWKAAADKEVASLRKNDVYTLLPATSVPSEHKIIGSRCVFKIKANDSKKGRIVVQG